MFCFNLKPSHHLIHGSPFERERTEPQRTPQAIGGLLLIVVRLAPRPPAAASSNPIKKEKSLMRIRSAVMITKPTDSPNGAVVKPVFVTGIIYRIGR
jgi:hypothetical protein